MARMRAFFVSGRIEVFVDESAARERGFDLPVVRSAERVEDLDFDMDFVMRSSEVMRRHPPHHLSPARAKTPAGQDPEARFSSINSASNATLKSFAGPSGHSLGHTTPVSR